MKKILLSLAAIGSLLSTEVNAGHFYAGPYVGLGSTQGEFKINNANNTTVRKNRIGDSSFIGGLMAGYAYPCNNLFVGLELMGNIDTQSAKIINETTASVVETFKLQHRSTYGFAARIGFRTQADVVFYARLGGEWSSHKLSFNAFDPNTSLTFNASKNKTRFAFVPGIGIEAPLSAKWKMRLEGKYSLKQKSSITVPNGVNLAFDNLAAKVNASQTSVIMGVTYSF